MIITVNGLWIGTLCGSCHKPDLLIVTDEQEIHMRQILNRAGWREPTSRAGVLRRGGSYAEDGIYEKRYWLPFSLQWRHLNQHALDSRTCQSDKG